jgi:hypothetical protein
MNLPMHIDIAQYPARVRWIMGVAWLIIAVKCVVVWWAIGYWNMPFHPLWIVAPTIVFAALATVLWLTHHEE